ncbi:MAG: formate dehydrogenase accessory sulfurtransferase FdhD [Desulfatibacillaceae bacterium]
MSTTRTMAVKVATPDGGGSDEVHLIEEHPLSVLVDGVPMFRALRTPRDENAQAAGLCLAGGLVDSPSDIEGIFRHQDDPHTVDVKLARPAPDPAPGPAPVTRDVTVPCSRALACADDLAGRQHLHMETRSAHAATIYDGDVEVLTWAEDVGRHNAMDKAIGKVFLDDSLNLAVIVQLTCRMNREVIRKCARAGIPLLLSVSRPTAGAVDMAEELGITMACHDRKGGLLVFTHPRRISPG